MSAPLLPTQITDYLNLTRLGMEDRLRTLYNQANPDWVDFTPNYPENLILSGQAFINSLVAGAADERMRQLYWPLVTDRLSAQRMGRPMGFSMNGRTAASVDGTFSLPNGVAASRPISLPVGTKISTGNAIYTTSAALTFLQGATSLAASLRNVVQVTSAFSSDGTADQVLQLEQIPIADGEPDAFVITAGNGTYTSLNEAGLPFSSFMEMGPDILGYVAYKDNNGKVFVYFGNGVYGAIPTGTINVTYLVGGGVDGRVGAGAKWTVLDSLSDDLGSPATMLFNNTAASSGGDDEMTVEEARVLGPLSMLAIGPCVNEPQFETVSCRVSGVARAALMTSNQDPEIPEDQARLYLVAYGGQYSNKYYPPASPTATQIDAVEALIDKLGQHPRLMGVVVTVLHGVLRTLNIAVRIHKGTNATEDSVRAAIEDSLQKFFAVATDKKARNTKVDFGYKMLGSNGLPDYQVAWSDVFDAIRDSVGVRQIPPGPSDLKIDGYRSSAYLLKHEFPMLGAITIYDMDESGVEI